MNMEYKTINHKKVVIRALLLCFLFPASLFGMTFYNDVTRRATLLDGKGPGMKRTIERPFVCHYDSKNSSPWQEYCGLKEYLKNQFFLIIYLTFIFFVSIPVTLTILVIYFKVSKRKYLKYAKKRE